MKTKLTEAQARADYEADVKARPLYYDRKTRPVWDKLGRMAQESWRYTSNPDHEQGRRP